MDTNQVKTPQTDQLTEWVEQLGLRDWNMIRQAHQNLQNAGDVGMEAVVQGLTHPSPRVRRGCAGFMDHHGTDTGVPALVVAMQNDSVPSVRREAVHSLGCDTCKTNALCTDAIPFILKVIEKDSNTKVRYQAIYALTRRPPDTRTHTVLHHLLQTETNKDLRRAAHAALLYNNPDYRTNYNAQQRAAGLKIQAER